MEAFTEKYLGAIQQAVKPFIERAEAEREIKEKTIPELQEIELCVQQMLLIKTEVETLELGISVPSDLRTPIIPLFMPLTAPCEKFRDILFTTKYDYQIRIEQVVDKIPICIHCTALFIFYCYESTLCLCRSDTGNSICQMMAISVNRPVTRPVILRVDDDILLQYGMFQRITFKDFMRPSIVALSAKEVLDDSMFSCLNPRVSFTDYIVGYEGKELIIYSGVHDRALRFVLPMEWQNNVKIMMLMDLDARRFVLITNGSTFSPDFDSLLSPILFRLGEIKYLMDKREALLDQVDAKLLTIHNECIDEINRIKRKVQNASKALSKPVPSILPFLDCTIICPFGTPFRIVGEKMFCYQTDKKGVALLEVVQSDITRKKIIPLKKAHIRPMHVEQITDSSFVIASAFEAFTLNYEFCRLAVETIITAPTINPPDINLGYHFHYFTYQLDGIDMNHFVSLRYGPRVTFLKRDNETLILLGCDKWLIVDI